MASALSAILKGRYPTHRASHRRSRWSAGLVREFDCEAKGDAGRFRKAVEANRHNWLERGSTSRLPVDGPDCLRASAALVRRWDRIDPDSRLTQLGLDPRLPDVIVTVFSKAGPWRQRQRAAVPDLAARWADDPGAQPYVAPRPADVMPSDITVSLGVGENPAKRLDDKFERQLLQMLADTGASVLVDKGGTAPCTRVERALPSGARTHDGGLRAARRRNRTSEIVCRLRFCRRPRRVRLRRSAHQHRQGFVSERMAARWRPNGTVIDGNAPDVLDQVRHALATYTFRR